MSNQKQITPLTPQLGENHLAEIKLSSDDIDLMELEEKATQEGFKRNNDFHITIMGFESADALKGVLSKLNQTGQNGLMKKIEDLFQVLNWSFKLSQRYHIKKSGQFDSKHDRTEDRESYIQLVYLPSMEKFYKRLNKLLKTSLPTQVPHVTLFTKGEYKNPDYYGIPIHSKEEFDSLDPVIIE
ncbi:hypothetical protein KKG41_04060, partial [Patescibacteria group bacterium]|nr:hypothetical protein [Patescibacteria group bacterium]MBU1889954.1 hypothetical protein [Patescibacteria group bacterium]